MGYAPDYFAGTVAKWIDKGWLPLNGRIVEFGAQEFYCDQDEARNATGEFLRSRGIEETAIRGALPEDKPVAVRQAYRALGIDYLSIDVDGSFGSEYFDLNTFAPPIKWRAAFNLVNNAGTIEHLINPINGFQIAHELLKVGGVAVHSMPLTGWGDHGLMYPTVKFYAELLGANRYEMLEAEILVDKSPLDFTDGRFVVLDRDGRPLRNIADFKLIDAWVKLTLRKTIAAEFRVPFDHLTVDQPNELGRRLADNYASYSRARLTEDRPRDPAGDEFERQMEMQRRSFEHQRLMQQREHEHAENLVRDQQQHEHNHADKLARDLQQREHNHADLAGDPKILLESRPWVVSEVDTKRAESSPALVPLSVVLAIIALNGLALLAGIWKPLGEPSLAAFTCGFLLAVFPSLIAWTRFAQRPTRIALSIRHGAKLAWAAAAGAFAAGCLLAA